MKAHMPRGLPTHDPATGDALTRGEAASWIAQGVIRRWTFLLLFTAATLVVWTGVDPIWHRGATDVWNLTASYMAILIEGTVGIAMFSSTRRDAVILRELRDGRMQDAALLAEVRELNGRLEQLGELAIDYLQRAEDA